ncbi:MAG TPA: 6,7-dimethyl-8-ribityllumazine synthase [Candidatus Saccharimonadaceae bacterium]|nr:6,7-dimethyl-8-ribityllumazine synthase [Candidatus Saccharimonadaceae bacterium]
MSRDLPREETLDARGLRFAVIAARFNGPVVDRLLDAALSELKTCGAADEALEVFRVPGAFELPLACRWAAESGRFDALIALGAVIEGETDHYRLVADASSDGLSRVALDSGVPVANGVLACRSEAQAAARSGGALGNRGVDAARAAMSMAWLRRRLGRS